MDREWTESAAGDFIDSEEPLSDHGGRMDFGERPPPSWRGVVIAVVAAIVLSVTATILLGGSFLRDNGASAGGCGSGSACCPPVAGGE